MREREFCLVLGILEIETGMTMNDIVADIFINYFDIEGVDFV